VPHPPWVHVFAKSTRSCSLRTKSAAIAYIEFRHTKKLDIIEIGNQRRNWWSRKTFWLKLLYRIRLNKTSCHHWMLSIILWSLMAVILEFLLYVLQME
jgi:hypothetical protein